jgi:hypothetical protein
MIATIYILFPHSWLENNDDGGNDDGGNDDGGNVDVVMLMW